MNRRAARGRKRAPNLKNPDRIAAAMGVQRKRARQLSRCVELIDARCGRKPAQILAGQIDSDWQARQIVVRNGNITLSRAGRTVSRVYRAGGRHRAWRKSSHRGAGRHANIPGNHAGTGVGDRGVGQNRISGGGSKGYGHLGSRVRNHQQGGACRAQKVCGDLGQIHKLPLSNRCSLLLCRIHAHSFGRVRRHPHAEV